MTSHWEGQRHWRLDLPYTKPPLTMNQRWPHRAAEAKVIAQVRHDAYLLARSAAIPALSRIRVVLHYIPRDRRRRDPINLNATLKPLQDGLVDAGIVPDDTPDFMHSPQPVIDPHNPDKLLKRRLYLDIWSLEKP